MCNNMQHLKLFNPVKIEKWKTKKFTQGTTPFPNLDRTVYQLSELDVGTKCPDVTDTDSV
jgi:hypothetical protein